MEERIKKGSMSLEGNKLEIFGDWGMPKDGIWIVPRVGPTGSVEEISPRPITPSIEDLLNEDIENGVDHRINYIQVDTHAAIILFLEKKITKADIEAAVVGDSYVLFPPLTFNTKKGAMTFPITVTIDAEYEIATIDPGGEIV